MKLWQVVVDGRFCGLETVDECITNFYLHSIQMFPYNALEYELRELRNDIQNWEAGKLDLPWERINEEVSDRMKSYEEWLDSMEGDPSEVEELEFKLDQVGK